MLGLGLLLAQAAWLYNTIKLAGVAYLIYLGLLMILTARRGRASMDMKPAPPMSAIRYVGKGYLVAVSNPTAAIFFGSVFSAMLPSVAPIWVYVSAVGLVTGVSAIWHCGIGVVFSVRPIQAAYRRMKRGIDAVAGTVLVLLGVRLAISR
jgi:threonine/homoserine/homoserine lactone efflux protein